MALVLGTNVGFVTTAPTDSAGSNSTMDIYSKAIRDTSPATAIKITEIGWWCSPATEEANFEVGIYSDDGTDEPNLLLRLARTNAKGTTSEWKRVTVDWDISGSTTYWIAVQLDDTATATKTEFVNSGGSGTAYLWNQTTLLSDWGTSGGTDVDGMYSIYAVVEVEEAPPGTNIKINIADTWKEVSAIKVNIGDAWKDVTSVKVNVGDAWRTVF